MAKLNIARKEADLVILILSEFKRIYLRDVVSILEQEMRSLPLALEILLVDTRESNDWIESPELKLLHQTSEIIFIPFSNFAETRRDSLKVAKARYPKSTFLFLDDDDVPEPDFIREIWATHLRHPDCLVSGIVYRNKNQPLNSRLTKRDREVKFIGASTLLISNTLVDFVISSFNQARCLPAGEDTFTCVKARLEGIQLIRNENAAAISFSESGNPLRVIFYNSWLYVRVQYKANLKHLAALNIFLALIRKLIFLPFQFKKSAAGILGMLMGFTAISLPNRSWLRK
jgi:hypothetical protein